MFAPQRLGQNDDGIFQSSWLQALVQFDRTILPPPLPSVPGAVELSHQAPSTISDSEGYQLAQYYYQRTEQVASSLAEEGKGLTQVANHIKKYTTYCRSRLTRLFDGIDPKERTHFALIPYLLNANAAGIPGYQSSGKTPYGVKNCDFNATIMRAVEQIFGHRKRQNTREEAAIRSIFCETEIGSMSLRRERTIHLWLILQEGLMNKDESKLIYGKLHELREWLLQRNLDIKFHLVDPVTGYLPHEEQKSMSFAMLREKLYRDAFYLMGDLPMWWIAPLGIQPDSYTRLTATLDGKKYNDMLSLIDLGCLQAPEPNELLNDGLDDLNKALYNPFHGALQLALSYVRLEGVPFNYLCERLKKNIFEGKLELEHTDLRFGVLDVLNHHFTDGQDRYLLRLFRVCAYLDIGVPVSRKKNDRKSLIMQQYVNEWGWDQDLVQELDYFFNWPIEKMDVLAREVRRFLLDLYRRMSGQAQNLSVKLDEKRDIIRRRRLSACFEVMNGKINHLFTYFLPQTQKEEHLVFVETPNAPSYLRWEVYREEDKAHFKPPIYAGETLVNVGAWLVFNGIFHPHSIVSIISQRPEYNIVETRSMLSKMHAMFNYPNPLTLSDQHFVAPPQIKRLLIWVNPTSFQEENSALYATQGWDILNYGQQRKSQLTDISLITQNSWGEFFCRRYQGADAFTQAMRSVYADAGTHINLDQVPEVIGPNDRVQPIVRKRVQEVLKQANEVFFGDPKNANLFAYEVGGQFQILYKDRYGARINTVRTLRGVLRRAGRLSNDDQTIHIDQLSPSLREIRALVQQHEQDQEAMIYVGWRQHDRLGYVIVCDERKRLYFQQSSARETRLGVIRVVRRLLPYLKARVSNVMDLKKALRVFEFQEGQVIAGKGPSFTEATSQVLGALSKAQTIGSSALFLIGSFDKGRKGLGLQYGQEQFMYSRYGSSFVYTCVKRIVDQEKFDDPEAWTIDGSRVDFGPKFKEKPAGAIQHLRLIAIYQKEITKALNQILQNSFQMPTPTSVGFTPPFPTQQGGNDSPPFQN
jgi:adenylate cyclase class 1